MHTAALTPLVLLAAGSFLAAQTPCDGGGAIDAFLVATPLVIGGQASALFGSAAAPGDLAVFGLADAITTSSLPIPGLGSLCLDLASPALALFPVVLDASGSALLGSPMPTDPLLALQPPLFALAVVHNSGGFAVTRTARMQWTLHDSYAALGQRVARSMHTATPLFGSLLAHDQSVLIAGGATGSILAPTPFALTEIFEPLTRTFRPGPSLSLPRAMHTAVRLFDGRILISGGATTNALCTATCDLFDPVTETIQPAATMLVPRAAHAATLLPDGRVLVTGGFADWQNAATNFAARLGTAHATSEIYDPLANTWTPGPAMLERRAGHSQTAMPDGSIVIVGGVNGGTTVVTSGTSTQVPTFAISSQIYQPVSNGFTLAPPISPARAFHGASLLANGTLLVTGGAAAIGPSGSASCTPTCATLTGLTWTPGTPLPVGVAFHTQVFDHETGGALIAGGFTLDFGFNPASAQVGIHTGTSFLPMPQLGNPTPAQRAAHSATVLLDGTVLFFGGQSPVSSSVTTFGDAFLWFH